jgi:hypothetical protein
VSVLYGAWTKPAATSDTRIFTSYYRDSRDDVVKVDNRPLPVRSRRHRCHWRHDAGPASSAHTEYGQRKADLLFWGALQGGDWGRQSHRAGAFALEAGYQPKSMKWKPWVRVGYNASTGDDDATDDRHGTFFQMLPTPRIYARTPFYNSMNNRDLFAQLILRPSARPQCARMYIVLIWPTRTTCITRAEASFSTIRSAMRAAPVSARPDWRTCMTSASITN